MTDNWVKVYSTNQPHLASILKDRLDEEGIPCVLVNKQDSAYLFGYIEVFVHSDQVVRATHLIKTKMADE